MGKNKKKSSHRNQSNSTSLNTHNKNCVICLEGNKNQEFARLKECNHEFCKKCIKQWASASSSPKCPLCSLPFNIIISSRGNKEEYVEAAQPGTSEEVDLGCLDHSYFIGDVNRLLRRAEATRSELFRCRHKNYVNYENKYSTIITIIDKLKTHKDMLEHGLHFNPNELLQELYNFDALVIQIQTDTLERNLPLVNEGMRRYGADDIPPEDEDEDEDEDEMRIDMDYDEDRSLRRVPSSNRRNHLDNVNVTYRFQKPFEKNEHNTGSVYKNKKKYKKAMLKKQLADI